MTSQNIWDELWGDSEKEEIAPKSSYNSVKLAQYFQTKFFSAAWHSGFGMVNQRALAGALAKWKPRTDSDTVKVMIDRYMDDESFRGKNPGWQDFLYNAERISESLKPVEIKDKWDLLEEELERKHGK